MPITATPISSGSASGRYASQFDIESIFGIDNVRVWSQLDNSVATADETRIQKSLDYADAKIIQTFATLGNYARPLTPLDTDALLVARWAATLAGAWLYQSRGLRDQDALADHMTKLVSQIESEMHDARSMEKLNAARRWPTSTSPVAAD